MTAASVVNARATDWLLNGERGLSSEAMVKHLVGVEFRTNSRGDYPIDLDDFRRCEVALREIDGLRARLPEMAKVSDPWRQLVSQWDEIVRLVEADHPEWFQRYHWATPRASLWGTPAHDLLRRSIGRDA